MCLCIMMYRFRRITLNTVTYFVTNICFNFTGISEMERALCFVNGIIPPDMARCTQIEYKACLKIQTCRSVIGKGDLFFF